LTKTYPTVLYDTKYANEQYIPFLLVENFPSEDNEKGD